MDSTERGKPKEKALKSEPCLPIPNHDPKSKQTDDHFWDIRARAGLYSLDFPDFSSHSWTSLAIRGRLSDQLKVHY